MEVVIHPKSNLKVGDTLRVAVIHENRLDVASMKYVRSAILEHTQQSVQPTALGGGKRGHLANLLVSLGKYLVKIGGG